jgi:hypothetical protein
MSNEVTKYDEQFAAMAAQYAGTERAGGDFLSTKGGVLTFDDETLPGNQMCVIILDVVKERTFYTSKYSADREANLPPVCYAFGREDAEMAPHVTMQADLTYFQPQNDTCQGCPNDAWGTADTGRGKACRERRRFALLPAGYYVPKRGSRDFELNVFDDLDHFKNADIAFLKIPVTSVKDWARYVTQLSASHRRPPAGVITRVYIEPDQKSQFRVKFEMLDLVPSDLIPTIMERYEEAQNTIVFGYPPPSPEAKASASGVRR